MIATLRGNKTRLLVLVSLLVFVGAMLVWSSTTGSGTGFPGAGVALAHYAIDGSYGADSHGNDDIAARVRKIRCDVQVKLSAVDQLDIQMSLNLLLCPDRTLIEPSPTAVYDQVRGNGFYTIGDSESTGGRLVITGGRYTNAGSDPSRIIVVETKSGVLKGRIYNLHFSHITGCEINGRWAQWESPNVLMPLGEGLIVQTPTVRFPN